MTHSASATAVVPVNTVNGVDVDQVMGVLDAINEDKAMAHMQFRVGNQWIEGGLNRSNIKGFYAACQEDDSRTKAFCVDNDEPSIIAGSDSTPNPMEYVLHALAGCLTTTLVYHAAVQGIAIDAVESGLEGDMDARGLFGISDSVRKSFHHVRVRMKVKSEASADQIRELAMHSPVFDLVSNSLPTELVIEKY